MKKYMVFLALALLAGPLLAADAGSRDKIINAAKQLADKNNYSWDVTVTNLNSRRFHFGPNEGKIEKGGYTWYSIKMNDNTTEILMQGTNAAVKPPDNSWETRAEATQGSDEPGPAMFLARMLDNFQTPPQQAEDLASKTKDIQKKDGIYTGDLTDSGAQDLLSWRRGSHGNGPSVSNAKGWVKFWVEHGLLTKYQFNLQGTLNFSDNDFNVNRTTTVEIKDVWSTRITPPDEAKKKLSP